MIYEEFQQYVAEVVERHFKDAPGPDGTTETNKHHIALKSAACKEIYDYISSLNMDEDLKYEIENFAEKKAQSAIYAFFTTIKRKPKRYK